jgi:hypothetical protein
LLVRALLLRVLMRRLFGVGVRLVGTAPLHGLRQVLYGSLGRRAGATVDLEHAAVELPSAGADPG